MIKKVGLFLTIMSLTLVFSGCGIGNVSTPVNAPAPSVPKSTELDKAASQSELPVPTGKVDDTVSAIIDQAGSEQEKAASDESDAKSSVDTTQETNNLSQSYDPNEL